jgi:recombination protein RecA
MGKEPALKILGEKDLRKKYPNANKATIIIESAEDTLWLPSRNLALNAQLGGGFPYGRVIEIIGYQSTGKTLMAQDFCSVAQALGGQILWDDAEGAWTNYWAKKLQIDPTTVELYTGNDVEGFSDWMRDMLIYYRSKLVNNEPIVIVIDSIAALECKENIESDQSEGKAEMGNRAKAIYKMYRKRNDMLRKYGAILIAINQVRDKVGASLYEAAETTPGGSATKFYASIRIMLVRSKQILATVKGRKDVKVGQNIIMKVDKNKVAPPEGGIKTDVYFKDALWGYVGYSRYKGVDELLIDEGIIKKKGSRYYRKDKMIANGEDGFIKMMHEDEKMRGLLIRKSSINTLSKTRDKIEGLTRNMYPVKLKKKGESDDE